MADQRSDATPSRNRSPVPIAESQQAVDSNKVTSPKKIPGKANITQYLPLVERVAKVEYRRIPSHMVDYEELVSIGAIAIQALLKNKTEEEIEKLNTSYMATATRWAIRNELRSRYKWYTLKHAKGTEDEEESGTTVQDGSSTTREQTPASEAPSTETVREAIYETIDRKSVV